MTNPGPHVGTPVADMSLATANLIHSYALPLLIVGAILILAGTIGVFVSDGVRGRYADQAVRVASLQALGSGRGDHGSPQQPETSSAAIPSAPPLQKIAGQTQLMTATTASQTLAPTSASAPSPSSPAPGSPVLNSPAINSPAASSVAESSLAAASTAANTIQSGAQAPTPPPEPHRTPRSLSSAQRASMLAALHGAAEDIWFVTERDPEAQNYADLLGAVFREAGWTDHHALVLHPGQPFQGVSARLKTTSADRSVSRAFAAAGLSVTFRENSGDEPAPSIYVGSSNAAP